MTSLSLAGLSLPSSFPGGRGGGVNKRSTHTCTSWCAYAAMSGSSCSFRAHSCDLTPLRALPPPPCPNTDRFWFNANVRKHGVAVSGKAHVTAQHVPRNTCCQPSPSNHDNTKQHAGVHPSTQEHVKVQLHQHFDTHIDPSCSLHQATNHVLDWIGTAKTMVPKRGPKVRKHRVAVLVQGGGLPCCVVHFTGIPLARISSKR